MYLKVRVEQHAGFCYLARRRDGARKAGCDGRQVVSLWRRSSVDKQQQCAQGWLFLAASTSARLTAFAELAQVD